MTRRRTGKPVSAEECGICARIRRAGLGRDPGLILELETGFAVLEDRQAFPGWVIFLCKRHVSELHLLGPAYRRKYLADMCLVAEAVHAAVKPRKLNYELLGNVCPHLHWHIIPRYRNDPAPLEPVWGIAGRLAGKPMGEKGRKILKKAIASKIRSLLRQRPGRS